MADTDVKTENTENVEETVVEETQPTEETVEETEDGEETSEENDEEESEEDKVLSRNLLKALRDPNRSESVIRNLAKNLGIKIGGDDVKDETKAVDKATGKVKSISELVDKHLPPQWKPMSQFLTAVLEEFQSEYVETKLQKTETDKHQERSDAAIEYLNNKYKDVAQYESKMAEIGADMAPSRLGNQKDYNKYIERIYQLAKGGSSDDGDINTRIAKAFGKTVKNAKRAKPGPSDVNRVKQDNTAKTPREAIAQAMEQLRKKQDK